MSRSDNQGTFSPQDLNRGGKCTPDDQNQEENTHGAKIHPARPKRRGKILADHPLPPSQPTPTTKTKRKNTHIAKKHDQNGEEQYPRPGHNYPPIFCARFHLLRGALCTIIIFVRTGPDQSRPDRTGSGPDRMKVRPATRNKQKHVCF